MSVTGSRGSEHRRWKLQARPKSHRASFTGHHGVAHAANMSIVSQFYPQDSPPQAENRRLSGFLMRFRIARDPCSKSPKLPRQKSDWSHRGAPHEPARYANCRRNVAALLCRAMTKRRRSHICRCGRVDDEFLSLAASYTVFADAADCVCAEAPSSGIVAPVNQLDPNKTPVDGFLPCPTAPVKRCYRVLRVSMSNAGIAA
jgi:hypothetical protein